jgi:hypothetical protein
MTLVREIDCVVHLSLKLEVSYIYSDLILEENNSKTCSSSFPC